MVTFNLNFHSFETGMWMVHTMEQEHVIHVHCLSKQEAMQMHRDHAMCNKCKKNHT